MSTVNFDLDRKIVYTKADRALLMSRRAVLAGLGGVVATAAMPANLSAAASALSSPSDILLQQACHPTHVIPIRLWSVVGRGHVKLPASSIVDITFGKDGGWVHEFAGYAGREIITHRHYVEGLTSDIIKKAISLAKSMPVEGVVDASPAALDVLRLRSLQRVSSSTLSAESEGALAEAGEAESLSMRSLLTNNVRRAGRILLARLTGDKTERAPSTPVARRVSLINRKALSQS